MAKIQDDSFKANHSRGMHLCKFIYNAKTSEAYARMCAMLQSATHPPNSAIRVSVVKRGCTGLTHKIDISMPSERDEIVNVKGNTLVTRLLQRFEAMCGP